MGRTGGGKIGTKGRGKRERRFPFPWIRGSGKFWGFVEPKRFCIGTDFPKILGGCWSHKTLHLEVCVGHKSFMPQTELGNELIPAL